MGFPYSLDTVGLTFSRQDFQEQNFLIFFNIKYGSCSEFLWAGTAIETLHPGLKAQYFLVSYHKVFSVLTENVSNFSSPAHKPFSTYF